MALNKDKEFLGHGWSFPVRLASDGEIEMVSYEEDIKQSVLLILNTAKIERVMRPDFGVGLRELTFKPLSTATVSLIKHHIEEALINWEPRIDNISMTHQIEHQAGKIEITLTYRVRTTNTFYNLVYPFYLQEGQL